MKKIISLLLAVSMILTIGLINTSAQEVTPVLKLEAGNLEDGFITVNVTLKNNPGIACYGLRLKYNMDLITPESFSNDGSAISGSLSSNYMTGDGEELGYVNFLVSNLNNSYEDGLVLSATFKLKQELDTTVDNVFDFYLTYPNGFAGWNETETRLIKYYPEIENATVTVEAEKQNQTTGGYVSTGGSSSVKNPVAVEKPKPATWKNASDWAEPELKLANDIRIIPTVLDGADMKVSITRKEFASLAVRLYETLTGKKATVGKNPFEDTKDQEILKAYNLGITLGMDEKTFAPDLEITREQVATMLFRTIEIAKGKQSFDTSSVQKFGDNDNINDWAYDAVYFMKENDIIKGVGDNLFDAKSNTTREASIAIAVRSFYNL